MDDFRQPMLPISAESTTPPVPRSLAQQDDEDDDDGFGPRPPYSRGVAVTTTWTPPPKPHEVKIDPIDVEIQRALVEYRTGFDGNTDALFADATMTKNKTMILSGNGLWCYVQNPAFKMVHVYVPISFQAHHTNLEPRYHLIAPKLPGHMLSSILAFFRYFTVREKLDRTTEAMSQVYWDSNTNEYFINIPDQEVTGGGVHFNFEKNDPRCFQAGVFKVFDIHSHNTMGAFFSGVDDKDERDSDQFFGVIGTISSTGYSWRWRWGVNGNFTEIDVKDIVDLSTFDENNGTFPEAWLERVRFPKPEDFISRAAEVVSGAAQFWDRTWGHSPSPYSSPRPYYQGAGTRWWESNDRFSEARTAAFSPVGRPPYGGSRGEWFKYLLNNIKLVISTPKQVTKLLSVALSGPMTSSEVMHRVRTLLGQREAKGKDSLDKIV